jgi:hypothetical protein
MKILPFIRKPGNKGNQEKEFIRKAGKQERKFTIFIHE